MAGYGFFWQWTAVIALAATVGLAVFFRDESEEPKSGAPADESSK